MKSFWQAFGCLINHNRLPATWTLSKISLGWMCQLGNFVPGKSGLPDGGIPKLYFSLSALPWFLFLLTQLKKWFFKWISFEYHFQMNIISIFLLMASSFSRITEVYNFRTTEIYNADTWSFSEFVLSLNPLIQCSFWLPFSALSLFSLSYPSLNHLVYFLLQSGYTSLPHQLTKVQHLSIILHKNLTPICSVPAEWTPNFLV